MVDWLEEGVLRYVIHIYIYICVCEREEWKCGTEKKTRREITKIMVFAHQHIQTYMYLAFLGSPHRQGMNLLHFELNVDDLLNMRLQFLVKNLWEVIV